MRGSLWLSYLQDAANAEFKNEDFWKKWISGLSDTYSWDEGKQIQFIPSACDFDYMPVALWDRFMFLVAKQVLTGAASPKEEVDWHALGEKVDIPAEVIRTGRDNMVNWLVEAARVDALCLQEANGISVQDGWSTFPSAGAPTVVMVRDACVDRDITATASNACIEIKGHLCRVMVEWARIQDNMIKAASETMKKIVHTEIQCLEAQAMEENRDLEHDVAQDVVNSIDKLAEAEMKDMVGKLEELKTAANTKQLQKIRRWFEDDKISVVTANLNGELTLIMSGHCESLGTTCLIVLALAHALQSEMKDKGHDLSVLVGMDSNVKVTNQGAAASPEKLGDAARALGFQWYNKDELVFAGSETQATHSVLKSRTFLQTQLAGKAGVPDENLKDWVFYRTNSTGTAEDHWPCREQDNARFLRGRVRRGRHASWS